MAGSLFGMWRFGLKLGAGCDEWSILLASHIVIGAAWSGVMVPFRCNQSAVLCHYKASMRVDAAVNVGLMKVM